MGGEPGRHRVAVMASDQAYGFDLGIPGRVFDVATDDNGNRLYRVDVCTIDGGAVRTSGGFLVQPDHGAEALAAADTVVVPPRGDCPTVEAGTLDPRVADALRAAAERGARIMSLCTGAFTLAAAGLLDGRPATTHWLLADRFRRLFPAVRVNEGVLFVDDGDVLTSAGAAAGIDLCLHVVRCDHGTRVANRAARNCVVPPWREGGQAQYIDNPVPAATDTGTGPAREWAAANLGHPISLELLAGKAHMSVRTFTRRFREETGISPTQWLIRQRVHQARHLLEDTDLSVEQVARETGFGTATAMRKQMRALVGIAPQAYRQAFQSPQPQGEAAAG